MLVGRAVRLALSSSICAATLLASGAAPTPPNGAFVPAGTAASNRLENWDVGQRLLDNGEIDQATGWFENLLNTNPDDLLAAEGFHEAWLRQCRLDTALVRAGRPGAAVPGAIAAGRSAPAPAPQSAGAVLRTFFKAERLLVDWQLAAAATSFSEAADLAAARGDSLSVSVALLEAAWSLARENRIEESRALSTRARNAAAAFIHGSGSGRLAGADRLCDELALHEADLENIGGRLATADSLYRALLPRLSAAGRRRLECDALNGLGRSLSRRRLVQESVDCFKRSLNLATALGDPQRVAQALSNLGYDEIQRRELDSAADHLERARQIADQCGIDHQVGFIEVSLGALAETRGDRPGAAARFRSGVDAHRRANNRSGELDARQRLAYALLMMGEYREAIGHYEKCLALGDSLGTPTARNWVLGGLALAYHKLGALERAAEYYRRTLELNESLGDRASVAWCLNSLGLVSRLEGDFREALIHHHRALEIFQELNDSEWTGRTLVSLSDVHLALGDYERAFEEARQAFGMAQRESLEELLREAVSALAAASAASGKSDTAGGYLRKALEIARRWKDQEGVVHALADLSEYELDLGRAAEARRLLREAGELLEPVGQWALRARVLRLEARCASSPGEAAALADCAREAAVTGGIPESEWRCLSDLGLYHRALGDTAAALAFELEAIDVIESLRGRAGLDELRRHMLRPAMEPYERAVDLLLSASPSRAAIVSALACAERSRAQILSQRLNRGMAAAAPVSSDEEAHLSRVAYLQTQLQEASLNPGRREALRDEIRTIEGQYAVERLANPGVSEPFTSRPLDGSVVEGLLAVLKPGERLVYYILGEERSWLVSARSGRLSAHRLPGRESLEPKVAVYRDLLRESGAAALPGEILETARGELYDILLGPLEPEMAPGEVLVLILDGPLHRLPMASLRGKTGYLMESHEIFIAPSLQALAALRDRASAREEAPPPQYDIVAVGHPGREEGQAADRVLPFTGDPVPRLPYAEGEARRVSSLFRRPLSLTGTAASEAALKRSPLDRCGILHIAAHGSAHETEIGHSFLLLEAADQGGRGVPVEDGLLQWHEAAALPLSASLVTLASCRSADGVLAAGEGVTGITQAFLHAGGSCVLAAQSDVPDELSQKMMVSFYRRFREGRPAAEALQLAQIEARRMAGGSACAWAGFVLVGDGSVTMRKVPSDGSSPALKLGAVAVVALLCVIFLAGRSNRWRRG